MSRWGFQFMPDLKIILQIESFRLNLNINYVRFYGSPWILHNHR